MEEVGDNGLLQGLPALFPRPVRETMSAVGVYEDTAVGTAYERAPSQKIKLREDDWAAYISKPRARALSLNFFAQALALSSPYAWSE